MPNGHGFWIEASHIDLELYRLVATVLASPALAESARNDASAGALNHSEYLSSRRFPASWALPWVPWCGTNWKAKLRYRLQRPVGTLITDLEKPLQSKPLTFKEI